MICEECHKLADSAARGWRAYLLDGPSGCAHEVVFYCPGCALAEFGPPRERAEGRE